MCLFIFPIWNVSFGRVTSPTNQSEFQRASVPCWGLMPPGLAQAQGLQPPLWGTAWEEPVHSSTRPWAGDGPSALAVLAWGCSCIFRDLHLVLPLLPTPAQAALGRAQPDPPREGNAHAQRHKFSVSSWKVPIQNKISGEATALWSTAITPCTWLRVPLQGVCVV